MTEWWTYRLSDFLMFAPRTYYRLFALYNAEVWPAHLMALAAGVAITALVLRPRPAGGRIIAGLLALAWAWVAWAYLHRHYATIHWAADHMALAFAAQAALLVGYSIVSGISVAERITSGTYIGIAMMVYGVAVQPVIGMVLGRPWMQAEVFGIGPDPTVIVTLGVLVASSRAQWLLLPIPLLWCVYNAATLGVMGSPEAIFLVVIPSVTLWVTIRNLGARATANPVQ